MLVWIVAGLSLLLFLAAAKTHGRQLRLEREQRGYLRVEFGSGTNPPWVEALWRRDRIRFWSLTAVMAGLAIAAALTVPGSVPVAATTQRPGLALALLGVLLWAPSVSFLALATLSQVRLLQHRRRAPDAAGTGVAARNGSLFWFGTDTLLGVLVFALTLL